MLNDGVLVSSAMDIATAMGRRKLITLLVHWSVCLEIQLGYDPTMRQLCDDDSSNYTDDVGVFSAGDAVIKDAWPPAEQPVESGTHNEIELLRQIRNQFEINSPVHLYLQLEIGGHVQLDIDGHSTI
ncbi:hypothetical protein COEREDRAFT_11764 [Coemansia reversa NRRL 1564]|uniref:Uncharacterized protein n=1 Tax=Coemansia reversa (strain ATCC 12441 / NRRL 1564) TaxID=763665 RepID=A0A2G5B318_COERN|nr:hypothetical protein COEREDRAFT_11764 [Coemansia reversa NRRL 1564]|eukprot:PIA13107.1 hypothetical protein COEREDRAFT_11764 [Coemansia reversa NRRL 1564]